MYISTSHSVTRCVVGLQRDHGQVATFLGLSYADGVINNLLHPGVISGSEQTATLESGYMDRDTYENSHLRGQSTFAGHRSRIYDIFLSYRKQKMGLGDFDVAERLVNSVLL